MNIKLLTFLLFIFTITKINAQDSNYFNDNIKLLISTDKKSYLESERIWQEIKLIIPKNIKLDYKPILAIGHDFTQEVLSMSNKQVPYSGAIYHVIRNKEDYPDTLRIFDVLDFGYFEEPSKYSMYLGSLYIIADKYKINASVDISINGKKYKIKSEPWEFEVSKPEGDEAIAREKYRELFPMIVKLSPNEERDTKKIADFMLNFMEQFPNSVYIDQVLINGSYSYFENYPKSIDEEIEFWKAVILKYPNFASNYRRMDRILSCYIYKKDPNGFLELVNELENKIGSNETFTKVLFYIMRNYERELKNNKFKKD